jgi:probable rRNA maturation factor
VPLLGELALSLERAAAQAAENGWSLRTEVLRLLAHGCAHVAGYDHESEAEEREMKALEVRLLDALGLRGLYPEDGAA